MGAKVKTRSLLAGSPCYFPKADGKSSGPMGRALGRDVGGWWAQRADPLMTLGSDFPLLASVS